MFDGSGGICIQEHDPEGTGRERRNTKEHKDGNTKGKPPVARDKKRLSNQTKKTNKQTKQTKAHNKGAISSYLMQRSALLQSNRPFRLPLGQMALYFSHRYTNTHTNKQTNARKLHRQFVSLLSFSGWRMEGEVPIVCLHLGAIIFKQERYRGWICSGSRKKSQMHLPFCHSTAGHIYMLSKEAHEEVRGVVVLFSHPT